MFVVEVAGLWQRPAAYPMNGAIRPDGRARLQIPYSRMGAEMQRLQRLGVRIISVNAQGTGSINGQGFPKTAKESAPTISPVFGVSTSSEPSEPDSDTPPPVVQPESLEATNLDQPQSSEDLSEQTEGDLPDPTLLRDTPAPLNSATPLPTLDTQASEAETAGAIDIALLHRPAVAEAQTMSPLEIDQTVLSKPLTIAVEPQLPQPTSTPDPQVSSESLVTWLAWGVGSIQAVILLTIGVQIFQTAHHLPLFPEAMQLLGTGVSLWWIYRWLLFAADRRAVGAQVTALQQAIVGAPSPGQPLQLPLKLTLNPPEEEDLVERVRETRVVEVLNLPSQDG